MVIGKGMLANAFISYSSVDNVIIFASGVSNSKTIDQCQFEREEKLLLDTMEKYENKTLIYFSSCALCDDKNLDIPYYKHKYEMEKLIEQHCSYYLIGRLPQAFSSQNNPYQLIGYLINSVLNKEVIDVIENAERYVIDVNDVFILIDRMIKNRIPSKVKIDIANDYRYKIDEIISIIENIYGIKAKYRFTNGEPRNIMLDLSNIKEFGYGMGFGKSYLENKLRKYSKSDYCHRINNDK